MSDVLEWIKSQIEWLVWQTREHPYRAGLLLALLIIANIWVRAIFHLGA